MGSQLTESGARYALMYRKDATAGVISSHFFIQVGQALVHLGLSAAVLPVIGRFYGSEVAWATLVFTGGRVIRSLGVTSGVMLEKELQFSRVAAVLSGSTTLSTVLLVVLAVNGFGFWSVVLAGSGVGVAYTVFESLGLSFCYPGAFRFKAERSSFGWLLRYCRSIWLGGQSTTAAQFFDRFIVGTMLGRTMVGYYEVAGRYAMYPTGALMLIVSRITLPVYSRLQNDGERLRRTFSAVFKIVMRLALPLFLVLFVGAREVMLLLAGPEWLPVAPVFQVLLLHSFLRSLQEDVSAFLFGTGWARLVARYWILVAALTVVLSTVGTSYLGLYGAALGISIAWMVGIVVAFSYVTRFMELDFRRTLTVPLVLSAVVIGLYGLAFRDTLSGSLVGSLIMKAGVSLLIFWGGLFLMERQSILGAARVAADRLRRS